MAALTFEHLPPKAAGNRGRSIAYGLEHWLGRRMPARRGVLLGTGFRDGAGRHSLCRRCNDVTGRWYAQELVRWAGGAAGLLAQLPHPAVIDAHGESASVGVRLVDAYPARLTKQMVAMLLSVAGPELGAANPGLRAFVLDKQARGVPEGVRLYLTLYLGPHARSSGVSGVVKAATGDLHVTVELAHPPLAYLMTLSGPPGIVPGDVTHLAQTAFERRCDLDLELLVGFGHTLYPTDYRSRAQIQAQTGRDLREAMMT